MVRGDRAPCCQLRYITYPAEVTSAEKVSVFSGQGVGLCRSDCFGGAEYACNGITDNELEEIDTEIALAWIVKGEHHDSMFNP